MKRRSFIKGLLGALALPFMAKVMPEPEPKLVKVGSISRNRAIYDGRFFAASTPMNDRAWLYGNRTGKTDHSHAAALMGEMGENAAKSMDDEIIRANNRWIENADMALRR